MVDQTSGLSETELKLKATITRLRTENAINTPANFYKTERFNESPAARMGVHRRGSIGNRSFH